MGGSQTGHTPVPRCYKSIIKQYQHCYIYELLISPVLSSPLNMFWHVDMLTTAPWHHGTGTTPGRGGVLLSGGSTWSSAGAACGMGEFQEWSQEWSLRNRMTKTIDASFAKLCKISLFSWYHHKCWVCFGGSDDNSKNGIDCHGDLWFIIRIVQ